MPDGPLEAMDRILLYVSRKAESADEFVPLSQHHYPIAFAKHAAEFNYFIFSLAKREYLELRGGSNYRLTPDGWERVNELLRTERGSSQAFVAMWFDKQLVPIYDEGFKPALETTGYSAIRIDRAQFSEKIDDKILAEIRRSGLLVADFTENRGGVYFEAGFSLGLGLPVIWTCREDHMKQVQFDTNHYPYIVWTDAADL